MNWRDKHGLRKIGKRVNGYLFNRIVHFILSWSAMLLALLLRDNLP